MWSIIRRRLHDLYFLYSSSQVILKGRQSVRGHFVTLIQISVHLTTCHPGLREQMWNCINKRRLFCCMARCHKLVLVTKALIFTARHSTEQPVYSREQLLQLGLQGACIQSRTAITVGPAGKASFLYSSLQTRLMCQYNPK